MDLTEADTIKKRWQEYTEDLHDPDNHDGMITPRARHLVIHSQVGVRKLTRNKASGGNGISVELFQILKDDAVKMLHSICQQIWKTQQWPLEKVSGLEKVSFHSNPKERQCQRML